jgi:hypothetical protein
MPLRFTCKMHQIRHFLALCEECNFTRAAKWSGISQPSLTNAISALERESGGALFQRKQFIVLTRSATLYSTTCVGSRKPPITPARRHRPFVRVTPPVNAEIAELQQADAESRVHLGLTAGGGLHHIDPRADGGRRIEPLCAGRGPAAGRSRLVRSPSLFLQSSDKRAGNTKRRRRNEPRRSEFCSATTSASRSCRNASM